MWKEFNCTYKFDFYCTRDNKRFESRILFEYRQCDRQYKGINTCANETGFINHEEGSSYLNAATALRTAAAQENRAAVTDERRVEWTAGHTRHSHGKHICITHFHLKQQKMSKSKYSQDTIYSLGSRCSNDKFFWILWEKIFFREHISDHLNVQLQLICCFSSYVSHPFLSEYIFLYIYIYVWL